VKSCACEKLNADVALSGTMLQQRSETPSNSPMITWSRAGSAALVQNISLEV
jgi:hypothetical protein